MKARQLGMLFAACITALLAAGCSGTRPGEIIVDKNVTSAVWSRDSQALYYFRGETGICRYDVNTGKRQMYRLPEAEGFDLSPDSKAVVFQCRGKGMYIADLKGGQRRCVLSATDEIQAVYWLTTDKIVFTRLFGRTENRSMYLLNPSDLSVAKIRDESVAVITSADGSGFIYVDRHEHYHHYLMKDGTDRMLTSASLANPRASAKFIYLSRRIAIYHVWYLTNTGEVITEMIDLSTMGTRRIKLPDSTYAMRVSPDMSQYWWSGPYHQDTEPVKLYLMDIPPATVKQLKAPVR